MAARKTARKSTAKKNGRSPASSRKTSKSRKSTASKKAASARRRPKSRRAKEISLGRPRIAGTAELNLVFQKDLEAREIFSFLDVRTLKELEALSPEDILELLTAPMVRTVDRIRKVLAMSNRSLKGDQKFARDFKKQLS